MTEIEAPNQIRIERLLYATGMEPKVSLVMACTWDQKQRTELLGRYLVGIDYPYAELVVSTMDELHEPTGKNLAAKQATTDTLIFTNCGVYPPYSLIERTRMEIQRNPNAFCYALRLDGVKELGAPGVFPNPFAVGDWQAMSRTTFEKLGGYNETFEQGGYIDTDMMCRAVNAGCDLVMMDERVYHCWHPDAFGAEPYAAVSERNRARMIEAGTPVWTIAWPEKYVESDAPYLVSPRAQESSVVPVELHKARAGTYWTIIFSEKTKRCFPRFVAPVNYSVKVLTAYPIAEDSFDHTHPDGAAADGSRNIDFVCEMVHLLNRAQPVAVLDLGCAGGQMIADFVNHGHRAVGLEGSDFPKLHNNYAWKDYADKALFTCDITRPFSIKIDDKPVIFDLITMWDVFEHIPEDRINTVVENILKHMDAQSLYLATISPLPCERDGVDLHRTQRQIEWWKERLSSWFEPVDYKVSHPIRLNDPPYLWRLRR